MDGLGKDLLAAAGGAQNQNAVLVFCKLFCILQQRVKSFVSGDRVRKLMFGHKAFVAQRLADMQLFALNPLNAVEREHHVRNVFAEIDWIAGQNILIVIQLQNHIFCGSVVGKQPPYRIVVNQLINTVSNQIPANFAPEKGLGALIADQNHAAFVGKQHNIAGVVDGQKHELILLRLCPERSRAVIGHLKVFLQGLARVNKHAAQAILLRLVADQSAAHDTAAALRLVFGNNAAELRYVLVDINQDWNRQQVVDLAGQRRVLLERKNDDRLVVIGYRLIVCREDIVQRRLNINNWFVRSLPQQLCIVTAGDQNIHVLHLGGKGHALAHERLGKNKVGVQFHKLDLPCQGKAQASDAHNTNFTTHILRATNSF